MVNEKMLEQIEHESGVAITTNNTGTAFTVDFPNTNDSITLHADTELELYVQIGRLEKTYQDMDGSQFIKETLSKMEQAARGYCNERADLQAAAACIKAGDAFSYRVGSGVYNAVAAEDAAVNYDADEPEMEIQIEGGGAVDITSLETLYPNIANHIIDTAKDYDVTTLDNGEEVLELPVQVDALGAYALSKEIPDRKAGNDAMLRFHQDMSCEIVAYGERLSDNEKAAWIYTPAPAEAEGLQEVAQHAVGEPVEDTIKRTLDTVKKVVFKLENTDVLNELVDEGIVTGLEYAGEHCEAASIKGSRLYLEETTVADVQDIKDMFERNNISYEECTQARYAGLEH